jgi:CrcB protein
MTYLWVSLAGVVGVSLRFCADNLIRINLFPAATLVVNIVGCFLAGFVLTSNNFSPVSRTSLLVGLCGGLTTFSALIIQCLQFFREGDFVRAFTYFMVSSLAGFLAAWAGMKLGTG